MITTISEDFYRSLSPTSTLISIENFNLKVEGAGGYTLPYLGYIECGLQIPFLGQQIIEVPALVVPTTDYSLNIPVVVGTNAIKICRKSVQTLLISQMNGKKHFYRYNKVVLEL